MRKKFSFFITTIFLLSTSLILGSCNNDGKSIDGKTIITFWHTHNDQETNTLKEIVDDYEKLHTNIKVELQQIPFSDAENKYKTVAQAKDAPDIFRAEISWTAEFASLGYLMALDMYMTDEYRKQFLSAPLKYNYYDNHYWGVPQVTDCLVLLYNKKIFKDANLEVPKTSDELVSTGKKLTDISKNKYAFFYRGDPYWFLPFLWSFGGGMVDDNKKILINNEDSVKALQYLIDLRIKDKIIPEVVDFANDYDNQQTGFKTGKYAMIINGPWSTSDILGGEEFKNPSNLGITRIPAGPKGFASPIGGHNYVIANNSKHLQESWDLINFLTKPENQAKFALRNNLLPTRLATYELPEVKKNHIIGDFKYVLEAANNRPVIPEGGALFVDLKQPYQAALLGEKSTKNALDEVANSWQKLFSK
ncbi:MAG: extracellular solute-binding protein [Candidatus Sericytochromatia bacterium]|nr:extracellular solute-binding protein [Candidatus Sericytochromatia bacterium]